MRAIVDGHDRELEMDFDAVSDYESTHPDWSIVDAISKAADSKRITDMSLLVGFLKLDGVRIPPSYVDYLDRGLTVDDMLVAFREGLTLLGFISEGGPSEE